MKKRIGDLAKQAGVGVETVRFYQRAGVLDAPEKPPRGWRSYGRTAELQLRYARTARRMGLSVSDIARLKERAGGGREGFCADVRTVVANRLAIVERELAQLERMRKELSDWLEACQARGSEPECPLYRELTAITPSVKQKQARRKTT